MSFTFKDRINEIESNIIDERWQSALALALTLPDICGGVAYPDMVKKYKDGRIKLDKYGKPIRDVGAQYIQWFENYASDFFKQNSLEELPYLSGERCWQLRCEYLHQNRGFINEPETEKIQFHLGINCGSSICDLNQNYIGDNVEHIRLDIQQLCTRLNLAAKQYYEDNYSKKDFDLYQTPVIDFIKWTDKRGVDIQKTIVVLSRNKLQGAGIKQVLSQVSGLIVSFSHIDEAKKYLGKKKPSLWIITEELFNQKNRPWEVDERPVVILSQKEAIVSNERYTWIPIFFNLVDLRTLVLSLLN